MAIRAYGRMVFWEGASLWLFGTKPGEGKFPKTEFHAHHAVQITLAVRGSFTLETRERFIEGRAAAVAPDTEHAFQGDGAVVHLFVDPDSRDGRDLQTALFAGEPLVTLSDIELASLESTRSDKALIDAGRDLLARLTPATNRDSRPELRVRKMSAWAAERLENPVTLEEAAAHVGLSTGRARHLFVEGTGMPFKTYVLWLRLMRAVEMHSAGASLTAAAHGAGFSDSSHLSRTFKRMFGIAADSLRM